MKVILSQAVKMFFGNSSLEMIYFEAVANALDAGADNISIKIQLQALNRPETLKIEISDNGEGFTNERFKKFSNLFDVEESSHKGLGRLVYLCYFDQISILSHYNNNLKREFNFSEGFDENNCKISQTTENKTGSVFTMSGYLLQKIAKNDFINPKKIKTRLLEEFYARLFKIKQNGIQIKIDIEANIEGSEIRDCLENTSIPDFKLVPINSTFSIIDQFDLYYSIKKVDPIESSLIAAIAVDERSVKVDLIADENIPVGYDMVFLLFSDYFIGKIDPSRQNISFSAKELKDIQQVFRIEVVKIIENEIPKIKKRNKEVQISLVNKYPHLSGYFETQNIGYVGKIEILKKAQEEFFKDQRELLNAGSLTEEQYQKALEVSSRALTEYILFRQLSIENLRKSTSDNTEAELHKLFAAMRKHGKFSKDNLADDIYRNNAWLLDDKYMTYETVLSDREFSELVSYITNEEAPSDDNRIDIALVFSNNPENKKPFDIVIVELKRRGITLEENMKVITQIEKRARKLMKFYKNQIQRIWYYGIIEINDEVELALVGEYKELYSSGKMYYRETDIAISLKPKIILPIGVFIWDLDAVIKDADARNSAFLNLIKSKFIQ